MYHILEHSILYIYTNKKIVTKQTEGKGEKRDNILSERDPPLIFFNYSLTTSFDFKCRETQQQERKKKILRRYNIYSKDQLSLHYHIPRTNKTTQKMKNRIDTIDARDIQSDRRYHKFQVLQDL